MLSFKIIGLVVPEKNSFKGFYHKKHGGHLGHVTWTIYRNFSSPFTRRLHMKFGFDCPCSFRVVRKNSDVHVYSPGEGADIPLGSMFFVVFFLQKT